jgi:hypothetical protein
VGFGEPDPAILAGIAVPKEHIGPREAEKLPGTPKRYESQEAQNRRRAHGEPDGPDFPIRFLDHLDLSLKEKLNCPLPGDNMKWLERRVEKQRMRHV